MNNYIKNELISIIFGIKHAQESRLDPHTLKSLLHNVTA